MTTGPLIAMIPARLGSQRLVRKNLAPYKGAPLIAHAIRKCFAAGCFDAVWVNSESAEIGAVAQAEGAQFHRRPPALADSVATSEQFVAEFLEAHPCEAVAQVHSIAPLLTAQEVAACVAAWRAGGQDVMLSCIEDQIEVAFRGRPVNFTFAEKTNSQDLTPVQRITWAITIWRREPYLAALRRGETATYGGDVGFFPVSAASGHVIKTQADLDIAEALSRVRG
ncbi:cytidylyltransferase domain-containing protein [Rubrimonas cliftonensis]|uniref:CMP-N-acetylneuraminic acid synthetase n=1 Tax=Rubrimonas cliftonensis TaxID=89524 RepID=A0A1H4CXZ0_9RHOB|nr:NTP transferase domain-containing protein [Rubrimonas cliftonensis]SEA65200.1 CMP-N-acetylneuraminic acid synthetase [Rubrimonas cliftonensis]